MPGICRSAITHDVPFNPPDCKKCSADEYAWTVYPCDLRNLLVAARTDASSSTMEITETVDKTSLPHAEPALVQHDRSVEKCAANQDFKIILRFARPLGNSDPTDQSPRLILHTAHLIDLQPNSRQTRSSPAVCLRRSPRAFEPAPLDHLAGPRNPYRDRKRRAAIELIIAQTSRAPDGPQRHPGGQRSCKGRPRVRQLCRANRGPPYFDNALGLLDIVSGDGDRRQLRHLFRWLLAAQERDKYVDSARLWPPGFCSMVPVRLPAFTSSSASGSAPNR